MDLVDKAGPVRLGALEDPESVANLVSADHRDPNRTTGMDRSGWNLGITRRGFKKQY